MPDASEGVDGYGQFDSGASSVASSSPLGAGAAAADDSSSRDDSSPGFLELNVDIIGGSFWERFPFLLISETKPSNKCTL